MSNIVDVSPESVTTDRDEVNVVGNDEQFNPVVFFNPLDVIYSAIDVAAANVAELEKTLAQPSIATSQDSPVLPKELREAFTKDLELHKNIIDKLTMDGESLTTLTDGLAKLCIKNSLVLASGKEFQATINISPVNFSVLSFLNGFVRSWGMAMLAEIKSDSDNERIKQFHEKLKTLENEESLEKLVKEVDLNTPIEVVLRVRYDSPLALR